jgi:hypothetical protein
MQKKMQLAANVAEKCLDEMLDPVSGFAIDAGLNHDGMATLLALRSKFTNSAVMPVGRYVDETPYRAALDLLKQ